MTEFDPNKDVESPCRRTGEWGFAGVLEDGTRVGIGVYSDYRVGAANANAWMRATPNAAGWEGVPLYVSLDTEEAEMVAAARAEVYNGGHEDDSHDS